MFSFRTYYFYKTFVEQERDELGGERFRNLDYKDAAGDDNSFWEYFTFKKGRLLNNYFGCTCTFFLSRVLINFISGGRKFLQSSIDSLRNKPCSLLLKNCKLYQANVMVSKEHIIHRREFRLFSFFL